MLNASIARSLVASPTGIRSGDDRSNLLRVALEFLRQIWRNVRDNQRGFAFVPQLEYMTNAMNFGDQRRLACRNAETGAQSPRTERILQGLHEPVHAFAGPRRDRYACRYRFV